jgi:anti-sigma B factor antagonist
MVRRFSIFITSDAQTARIGLTGEIDLSASPELFVHTTTLLGNEALTTIVVDLSDASFIDATGIGAIIFLKTRAEAAGRTVRVVGAHGQIARVFELLHLGDFLAGSREHQDA